jgi:hypothetical protein
LPSVTKREDHLKRTAAAEHGIAADRFAREIVGILTASPSALAATECQTVSPQAITLILDITHLSRYDSFHYFCKSVSRQYA